MKKQKKVLTCDGIEFDSKEEIQVYKWLLEAKELNLVLSFTYQPRTFTLCEAVPMVRKRYKFLKKDPFVRFESRSVNKVGKYVYTPDFEITFTEDMFLYYPDCFLGDTETPLLIDVKGDWNRGVNNTSGITFGIKAAWLYHTQGHFVQKVKPKELFKKTWVPEDCRYTPVKKQLIKEFTKPVYRTPDEAEVYRRNLKQLLEDNK